jgi:hypothetical protein
MAVETGAGHILVSSRPEDVARADRIVLPGDGAFPACRKALGAYGTKPLPSPNSLPTTATGRPPTPSQTPVLVVRSRCGTPSPAPTAAT